MNAELAATGENRIIVPTVYRNNYLMALKALSQNGITGALVRTLDFAQRYTAAVDFATLDRARFILDRTHALADPNEADANGIRLILPTLEILAEASQHCGGAGPGLQRPAGGFGTTGENRNYQFPRCRNSWPILPERVLAPVTAVSHAPCARAKCR